MKKKIFTLLLAVLMLMAYMPAFVVQSFAAGGQPVSATPVLDQSELNVALNKTATITATGDGQDKDYAWTSNDKTIATVTPKGKVCTVTGVGVGTTTVTLKKGTSTVSCTVNVKSFLKEAHWDIEGDTAEIELTSTLEKRASEDPPKVLFLGSLCDAHDLEKDTVTDSIEAIATKAIVDYRLFGLNISLNYPKKDNKNINPVEGRLEKNQKLPNAVKEKIILTTGYHVSFIYFADVINKLNLDDYDLIILEYDGMRMGRLFTDPDNKNADMKSAANVFSKLSTCYKTKTYNYTQPYKDNDTDATKQKAVQERLRIASNKLKSKYDQNRVAWLIPELIKTPNDDQKSATEGGYYLYDDKNLGREINNCKANKNQYIFARDFVYDTLSIISPNDWLAVKQGLKDEEGNYLRKELKDSDFTADKDFYDKNCLEYTQLCDENNMFNSDTRTGMWAEYGNAGTVAKMINAKTFELISYDTIHVEDTVKDGFDITDCYGMFFDENEPEKGWQKIDKKDTDKVRITKEGQEISADFSPKKIGSEEVKLVIKIQATDSTLYELKQGNDWRTADTNEDKATILYDGKSKGEEASPTLDEPMIRITKIADTDEVVYPGNKIKYSFKVENISKSATLYNIKIEDKRLGLTGDNVKTIDSLLPGNSKTVECDPYEVKVGDGIEGKLKNNVKVTSNTARDGKGKTVCDYGSVVNDYSNPHLTVTKTSDANGTVIVGQKITYTIRVTNDGEEKINGVKVSDPLTQNTGKEGEGALLNFGDIDCVAPNNYVERTVEHTVTASDIAENKITNVATATGTDSHGKEISATGNVSNEVYTPAITIEKTLKNPDAKIHLGDTVAYKLKITNTGNEDLKNVIVTDELTGNKRTEEGDTRINIGSLDVDASKEEEVSVTVTEDMLDAEGKLKNTASVEGVGVVSNEKVSDSDDITVPVIIARMEVEKLSNKNSDVALGETITYTINVKNIGNVDLKDVTVSDVLTENTGTAALKIDGVIKPNETKSVTATYTVTEADLLVGKIKNTATVVAKDPYNVEVNGQDDKEDTTVAAAPAIDVVKTTTFTGTAKVGDKIPYSITVENTGNLTLTNVTLTDELLGWKGETAKTIGTLAPNAKTTAYTGEYTVTEADLIAGRTVKNTAVAVGTSVDPSDPDETMEVSDSADVVTPLAEANPSLTIDKSTTFTGKAKLNEEVTYSILVTNNGNLTIHNIVVEDALVGMSGNSAEIIDVLAPGASKTITVKYKITETDIKNGANIQNKATVKGDNPLIPENPIVDEDTDDTVTPEDANSSISVNVVSDLEDQDKEYFSVGDTVTYTVTVTNDGNLTLNDTDITDIVEDVTGKTTKIDGTDSIKEFKPGDSVVLHYTYKVTEEDVVNGEIKNVASATGTDTKGQEVTDSDDVTDPVEEMGPSIAISKTDNLVSGLKKTKAEIGDTITYTVTVVNNGNVTISDIKVSDTVTQPKGKSATLKSGSESIEKLAPGESSVLTYSYVIGEDDIFKDNTLNTAAVTGKDPKGGEVKDSADDSVPTVDANPVINVIKTSNVDGVAKLGDTVIYTVTVTNSGNVTADNINVKDLLEGVELMPDQLETISNLAPGKSVDVKYSYKVTEDDIYAGKIINNVTVSGTAGGDHVTPPFDIDDEYENIVTTEVVDRTLLINKIITNKPANKDGYGEGEKIEYQIDVKNVGNVTIFDAEVKDELTGETWTVESIAPGESRKFETSYTVTASDVKAGKVKNVATIAGIDSKEAKTSTFTSEVVAPTYIEPEVIEETKTGDSNLLLLYLMTALLSLAGITVGGFVRKPKK